MNLEFLENLNHNNILITKKNIYRKYPSLINKYDLYILFEGDKLLFNQ